ncbi:MAG: trans-sulfuration enzyme family protein [Anaerolineales bacterium]
MKIETLAVHASNDPDAATGAIAAPIHLSTTYLRAEDGSYPGGYVYGRALAALEGGSAAAAFASGLAAIHSVFQALQPGDHAIVSTDIYHGTRALLQQVIERWGLQVSFVPFDDLTLVRNAFQKNTRLIYLETPSNPLLKIIDISEVAGLAHAAGALLVADNTLATPVLQRPLGLGADIVVHSSTKYFGGHSDVTGGTVIVREENEMFGRIRQVQTLAGGVPSPFDCWLVRRGLATLPLRVRAQAANAQVLAEFLSQHPAVSRVHYPGFPDHPGHVIAKNQMSAFGAMLSFQVAYAGDPAFGEAAARKLAASTKLFKQATSLGGIESMIEHRASIAGEDPSTPRDLLRLSVGIEAVEDLVADLKQGLDPNM